MDNSICNKSLTCKEYSMLTYHQHTGQKVELEIHSVELTVRRSWMVHLTITVGLAGSVDNSLWMFKKATRV